MKLYHIDRGGSITSGKTINLNNNVAFDEIDKIYEDAYFLVKNKYYKEGLSNHGLNYLLRNDFQYDKKMHLPVVMDVIFEYERLLNYPEKLSRYQSFFAFDKEGVLDYIKMTNIENSFYKIYEVESSYYEKYNMNLISGGEHFSISAMAKHYWENEDDPFERPTLNEYLLKFPVKIVKEVKIKDLK